MTNLSGIEKEALEFAALQKKWWNCNQKRASHEREPLQDIPRFIAVDFVIYRGDWPRPGMIINYVKNGWFNSIRVVVFKEKHGERYFLIRNQEDFAAAALTLIKDRHDQGWFRYLEGKPERPIPPKTSLEDAEAGKFDPQICKEVKELWRQYANALKQNEIEDEERVLIAKALKGDAVAAVRYICSRQKYEYEGFEVIRPEIPSRP
jgi:hypothetical protein